MKRIILFASISVMAGLLFANMYNSMVDANNWCSNMPQSIEQARQYFSVSNPGDFYRLFSPINQVLAIAALILFWRTDKGIRLNLGIALMLALFGDALTFGYFYPRNEILFHSDLSARLQPIADACTQWKGMNWFRSLTILAGLIFQFIALNRFINLQHGLDAAPERDLTLEEGTLP